MSDKIEFEGELMSRQQAVRKLVARGKSTREIVLMLGHLCSGKSIYQFIHIARSSVEAHRGAIDDRAVSAFENEARKRRVSARALMAMTLQAVADDNLFNAVLDK